MISRVQYADPSGACLEDLVADDERLEVRQPAANRRHGIRDAVEPAGGEVLLQAAHAVEHVVHPAAGGLLHHRLELLALAERVEDRGDGAQLQRVGAEEHQVVEHPVELGEQGAGPDRSLGDLHAEHLLDAQDHAELARERREPVVPVREHDDLAVVADLEELLGAAVHVAHDRLGAHDPLAVDHDPQAKDAVGGRVLGADVEHHVGRCQAAGTEPHGQLALGRGRHGTSVPHRAD